VQSIAFRVAINGFAGRERSLAEEETEPMWSIAPPRMPRFEEGLPEKTVLPVISKTVPMRNVM
jgi:hypothetical protein